MTRTGLNGQDRMGLHEMKWDRMRRGGDLKVGPRV